MGPATGPTSRQRTERWALFLTAALINVVLLGSFFDRYWYPSDEGVYAYRAEHLFAQDVDRRPIPTSYADFLNAAAFRAFGLDLISLRYPLVAASFIQACLIYMVLWRRSCVLAALGSVTAVSLGVIQFLDPTSHWYCLLLCTALIWWMTWLPNDHPARLAGAGVLLGTLMLFRQFTGAVVTMAVVAIALQEQSTDASGRRVFLARGLILVMLAALVMYLRLARVEPGGLIFVGAWPLAILALMLVHARTTNRSAAMILGQLAAGAAAAATPLLIYHLTHDSVGAWARETISVNSGITQVRFRGPGWYGVLPIVGLQQAISSSDVAKIVNGLYWAALPLIALVNGVLSARRFHRDGSVATLTLPIIAAFYALVSLHLEGPVYIYFSVGLSLAGVLWLNAGGSRSRQVACAGAAAALAVVAVLFHAAQSSSRTPLEFLEGRRTSSRTIPAGLPRCSLRLDPVDRDTYQQLVDRIRREVPADEAIFALPNDAELYFLANRVNPFPFHNSALAIRSSHDLSDVMHALACRPPRVVAFRSEDKYNTDASLAIMTYVRSRYDLIDALGGVELYRLGGGHRSACDTRAGQP